MTDRFQLLVSNTGHIIFDNKQGVFVTSTEVLDEANKLADRVAELEEEVELHVDANIKLEEEMEELEDELKETRLVLLRKTNHA